jgi:hypothetical protein
MTTNSTGLPLFTSDVTQEVQIRHLSSDGPAALPTVTIMEQFARTVKKYKNEPALHQKVPIPVRLNCRALWLGIIHPAYVCTLLPSFVMLGKIDQ